MAVPPSQGVTSSAPLSQVEELVRLKKILGKALPPSADGASEPLAGDESVEDVDIVLDALSTLEGIQVTRALLAKSKIGLTVGALRRHSNARVRNKSSALVAKWKTTINPSTPKSSSSSTTSTDAAASSAPAAASSSAPAGVKNGGGESRVCSARFPGPFSGDSTRDKARSFLWKALVDGLETAAAAPAAGTSTAAETGRVAAAIEGALWEKFIVQRQSIKDYNSQLKTLKWNLADPKNPDLNLKVLWGMYTAEQLASMTSAELASDEKKREREQQKQESLEACQSDWEVRRMISSGEAAQGQFPCFKCRTNKTVYFQMQTRSSDEPMTTFVTCLECGNRWKF